MSQQGEVVPCGKDCENVYLTFQHYRVTLIGIWVGLMFGFARTEVDHSRKNYASDVESANGSVAGLDLTQFVCLPFLIS